MAASSGVISGELYGKLLHNESRSDVGHRAGLWEKLTREDEVDAFGNDDVTVLDVP